MGAATSSNIAKITTEAISKVATDIIQKQSLNTSQSQMIKVVGGSGDVVIKNNVMNQKVQIDMTQLLKSLTTQTAQQNLAAQLAQQAKSLISGINLFQYTDSSNETDAFMKASIDISTRVSQECAATASQSQIIEVDARDGKIDIESNHMDQVTNIFSKCVENAVANSQTLQSLQQKLEQSASSETKGISAWALVILAILGLLMMAAPFIFGASTIFGTVSKFLFPLVLTAGIIMVVLYYTMTKPVMSGYGFSKLLSTMPDCGAVEASTQNSYATAGDASNACEQDGNCKAVDWQGMTVQPDGTAVILDQPKTTFYSAVAHSPCSNIVDHRDNLRIMRKPMVYVSTAAPDVNNLKPPIMGGDIWINSNTSEWSVWDVEQASFSPKDKLIDDFSGGNNITFDNSPGGPIANPSKKGQVVIKFAGDNKPYFDIYTAIEPTAGKLAWGIPVSKTVPGYVPYVPRGKNNANAINSTAFKKNVSRLNPSIKWIGFSLIGLGLFGTVYTFLRPNNKAQLNVAKQSKTKLDIAKLAKTK